MSSDASQVRAAGAVLDDEQQILAAQEHGIDMEVGRQDRLRPGLQERLPGEPERIGSGSMPASSRIRQIVDGTYLRPRPASSPWMRQ